MTRINIELTGTSPHLHAQHSYGYDSLSLFPKTAYEAAATKLYIKNHYTLYLPARHLISAVNKSLYVLDHDNWRVIGDPRFDAPSWRAVEFTREFDGYTASWSYPVFDKWTVRAEISVDQDKLDGAKLYAAFAKTSMRGLPIYAVYAPGEWGKFRITKWVPARVGVERSEPVAV